jgi:hypothetical protein
MRYLKHIYIFIAVIFITGCEDKLEGIGPEDALSAGAVFSNFDLIDATTLGIYDGMQDGDIIGGTTEFISDFMADDVNFVGSFTTLQDIRDFDSNATNGTIGGIWFDVFDIIRDANNIIVNLPDVNQADVSFSSPSDAANFGALKTQFIAEARFCRALATFIGVNLFAQPYQVGNGGELGLPIVTDFFSGDIAPFQSPRSTVNETHSFIEEDLMFAIANLPRTNGDRASSNAAKALLARLYLYREQWADAANYANQVISDGSFGLASDFTFYNNPSSEHIFQVINTTDDPAFGSRFDTFYNSTADNGRGDLTMTSNLEALYTSEAGDLRYTTLTKSGIDAGNNSATFTIKYPNGQTGSSDPNVIRIAEMYLIRAEANFRLGSSVGASPMADINRTRARAGLPALSGTVTLDDILNERRKELAFEGFRRMDKLRNNLNLKANSSNAISAPGGAKTILPLPDDELNNNPNAQQNPSY